MSIETILKIILVPVLAINILIVWVFTNNLVFSIVMSGVSLFLCILLWFILNRKIENDTKK